MPWQNACLPSATANILASEILAAASTVNNIQDVFDIQIPTYLLRGLLSYSLTLNLDMGFPSSLHLVIAAWLGHFQPSCNQLGLLIHDCKRYQFSLLNTG